MQLHSCVLIGIYLHWYSSICPIYIHLNQSGFICILWRSSEIIWIYIYIFFFFAFKWIYLQSSVFVCAYVYSALFICIHPHSPVFTWINFHLSEFILILLPSYAFICLVSLHPNLSAFICIYLHLSEITFIHYMHEFHLHLSLNYRC